MAGPGPICIETNRRNICDGTLSLTDSHVGPMGVFHDAEAAAQSAFHYLSAGAEHAYASAATGVASFTQAGVSLLELEQTVLRKYGDAAVRAAETHLSQLIAQVRNAADWATLNRVAAPILGPIPGTAGLLYGLVESLAGDALNLLGLAKMIVLSGVYQRLRTSGLALATDPITLALVLVARSSPAFEAEARRADEQLKKLLAELAEIAKHPVDFIETVGSNIWKGAKEDWRQLKSYGQDRSVTNEFQAGRITGRALYQIVMTLLLVVSVAGIVAKLAAKIPALLQLARAVRTGGSLEEIEAVGKATAGAGDAAASAARDAARTPKAPPAPEKPPPEATTAADVVASRRATAEDFYAKAGWSPERIASHMKGIDFNNPVDVVTLPKGTQVVQYQIPGNPAGNYFAPPGTSAESIGVNPAGRVATTYTTTEDVSVLRSTAADTAANTDLPPSVRGAGGGTQYFAPDISAFGGPQ